MSGESILLVDDNLDNLELTSMLLEVEGWEVRIAEDAQQALKALETYRPRLILMDVQLPGMDGLELTRRLRAQPAFQDVIIVALTAYAMRGDEENARAAGCDGYISKPIDTRTFVARVREYLESAGTTTLARPLAERASRPDASGPPGLASISDLVPRYLEGKRADAQRIMDALGREDFETIRTLGHNMKGTGNGYGFAAITEIGRNLEIAARGASVSGIQAQLSALSDLLNRVAET